MQVITCSGVYADGSLRIVRNGIGMIEQATVELPGMQTADKHINTDKFSCIVGCALTCHTLPAAAGIKGAWSLKATSMDAYDTLLVLTFVGETRVLAINAEDELDEAEVEGFDGDAQVRVVACTIR